MSHLGNDFSTFRSGVTAVTVKKSGWPVKKSSPFPLWGHRLPVTALALSARGLDKQHHSHHHHHRGGVNIRAGHASSHLHLHHHTIINISFIIVITLEDHLCGICVSQAANHLATSSDLTRPSQTRPDQTRLVIAMACFYVCSLNVFPSQLDDRKSWTQLAYFPREITEKISSGWKQNF